MPKKEQSELLDYVRREAKTFGKQFGGYHRWLVKRGKLRCTKPLTPTELEEVRALIRHSGLRPKLKECYYFSQLLALSAVDKLKYVEGLAVSVIPLEHAWVEYKGKVVDAVWGMLDSKRTPDGLSADPKAEYFGVEVPFKVMAENMTEQHVAESVLLRLFRKESGN